MKKDIKFLIIIAAIITGIIFTISCKSGANFQSFFTSINSEGGSINTTSWARLIDTGNNTIEWPNAVFYDGNNFYIAGIHIAQGRKIAIWKLDQNGDPIYSKYYHDYDYSYIGISDIFAYNNDKLLVGGWFGYNNINHNGFIGLLDMNTGDFTITKAYLDIGGTKITRDNNNIYIAASRGYIAKLNVNDFSVLSVVKVDNSRLSEISSQPLLNTNYICTFDFLHDAVLVFDNNLNFVRGYNSLSVSLPLIDENSRLYLFDYGAQGNFVISRINVTNGNVELSKSYGIDTQMTTAAFAFDNNGNTTHLLVGATFYNGQNYDIEFLKIDKNTLGVVWSVVLGTSGNDEIVSRTIFPTLDGGLFAARHINQGQYAYAVKLGPNGSLTSGCLFQLGTSNIVASEVNHIPTPYNTTTITNVTLTEISVHQLQIVNAETLNVLDLCINQQNGGGYFNTYQELNESRNVGEYNGSQL